jgi:hypothetical protein
MPHAVVGVVLVAHGLITTMIGFGSMTSPNSAAMPAPSWLAWWPGTLGRSWLLDASKVSLNSCGVRWPRRARSSEAGPVGPFAPVGTSSS